MKIGFLTGNRNQANKRGIEQIVITVLMILVGITILFLVFRWISGSAIEEGQKSGDRTVAQEVCREEVKIRVNDVKKNGEFFIINIENLKNKALSDFLIRYELGEEIEIKKARQVLNGYENGNIKVEAPGFEPKIVKVIPQIILERPELKNMDKGWWLCSGQMGVYTL